jgi:hypothetical protein
MNVNGETKVSVSLRPPKKLAEKPENVEVFEIDKVVTQVTICGSTDLIVNNFHEKSVQEMEDNRRLDGEGRRAAKRAPKPPVIPEEKYMRARILDSEGRDCFPARWVKAALVTAATKYGEIGVPGTVIRGAVFITGELLPITYEGVEPWPDLLPYLDKDHVSKVPFMRRDVVRVGKPPNKQPDLRYRPAYQGWALNLNIEYEPALVSAAGLFQLLRRAGTSVGLGEWRPEKSPAGTFGRFDMEEP